MQLITTLELTRRTKLELSVLFAAATSELARSKPQAASRRNALATLENIHRARFALYLRF